MQPALAEVLAARGTRSAARDEVHLNVPTEAEASELDAPLTTRGRADAIYNRFVIEFEPPGSLRPSLMHSATKHAINQVQQYLRGISEAEGLALERLAGCAFDGNFIVYVVGERDGWRISRPQPVDLGSISELLDTLEALAVGRGLTSVNLEQDFGRGSEVGLRLVSALYGALGNDPSARTRALFEQWMVELGATGTLSVADEAAWSQLCQDMGLPTEAGKAHAALFTLQTYFALVAKLVALVVLQGVTGRALIEDLESNNVWDGLNRLETGELTASVGALNVVEPGVFSWYADEEHESLEHALLAAIEATREYSAEVLDLSPLAARDVLKGLYQTVVPASIRHRLGEYYTPDWLVRHVVTATTEKEQEIDPDRRVLDPACGSGSFLVEVLARMIGSRAARRYARDDLLELLTSNVVGFDVSPLAVQAAKVSYLVALAPLIEPGIEGLVIPVYLADSVAPPRRGNVLEGDVFSVETSVKRWLVPASMCTSEGLKQAGEIFRKGSQDGEDWEWAVDRCRAEIAGFDPRIPGVAEAVRDTYNSLDQLEAEGRDGVWWEIIRNGFVPTLQARFDFVLGNPPWVSWETLAAEYREANAEQWDLYRLLPDAARGRRQASNRVRLDLAMLFLARSVAAYLVEDGRLGFVVPVTLFHSELAGRGFRRAFTPPDRSYAFVHLDDLRSLRVFEGAANLPGVVVARPQGPTSYPVPVTRWSADAGASIPFAASLDQVLDGRTLTPLAAEPVDTGDLGSPWAIMPRAALEATRSIRRPSPYLEDVREGINTRGANGVFFVEILEIDGERTRVRNLPRLGRDRALEQREGWVETAAVKHLLRGEDVSRAAGASALGLLFFHDSDHLSRPLPDRSAAERFPLAYDFMLPFQKRLQARSRFRGWDPSGEDWLGIYSVTAAAVAEHKVVIREISAELVARPIHSSDVVPDHKLHVIPCSSEGEAQALALTLNSDVVDYVVRSFSLSTSITGSLLRYVGIARLNARSGEGDPQAVAAAALGLHPAEYAALAAVAATN